ncbi:MAG: relaxase/mobilization nuclease domain-containing protein [Atopobiaceae bacterium]|jgi:hypothetical protein|nr:relaxase/mobilization nuclease domain-containing protein [Atopobiaceae bacterium]MCH4276846.1 relaxase/mobilization nuclease domain-containing protein [Atopobiaceae bacterium]
MTYVKPISGHTGLAGARRYFERDGRALAHDYLELDAPVIGEDEDGLPVYEDYAWDEAMDDRRAAEGNNSPWRGRQARTYKHYVLSPDPADAVTLARLRVMATSWARDSFLDFQVAIVYHDDNENHVPHAHVIVNNTNVRTGRRLQDPDPGALNGRLQAISQEMGLSHFEGRLDPDHRDTRETGARTDYQRVHVGREESEIAERDGYSWVTDIRARVDIARGVARDADDLRDVLSTMGITVEDTRNGDWKFALSAQPSRCVTGTRLGTDYQRPNVTRELSSPRRAKTPEGSRGRIEAIARDAMEVRDLAELRRLAETVGTARENHATSLEQLDAGATRARSRNDEGAVRRITRARAYASRNGILPEHDDSPGKTPGESTSSTIDTIRGLGPTSMKGNAPARQPQREERGQER